MINLMTIQPFIQDCVCVIASIVEANVTILDSNMIRIGGTGEYANSIGTKPSDKSFFSTILRTGQPGMIQDVKQSQSCNDCDNHKICTDLANLAYPIFLEGEVIGVIGIIAFCEGEKLRLLTKRTQLEEFLRHMSLLLESKIITTMKNDELKLQISNVIKEQTNPIHSFIIGNDFKIREILNLVDKIASADSTVAITGESGTGKEVLAKYIHTHSNRSDKLMISVNCAAIPENLVESELFGYEEGAFTGAKKQGHIGKFELANESTIFLDEIGDMPLFVQSKLLRVLQERKVERLGGKGSIPIDVRVICASNRNLEEMVQEGSFRQDLYYRLNVIPLYIPPLRARKDDIPLFVNYFITYYNNRLKKQIHGISPDAMAVLQQYSWPGNVRELRNIIEYLSNIVEQGYINYEDLPNQLHGKQIEYLDDKNLSDLLHDYEKALLTKLVKNANSLKEKDALATQLGISRATLYRKLSTHGLQ